MFGPETVIQLDVDLEIRCPASPAECTYVRVLDKEGVEVAYWDCAEWEEDPTGVMGAIMGCLKKGAD